jgi:hypothetical protein
MGDIVQSRATASIHGLYRTFNEAVGAANKNNKSILTSPLTITLGDEFQGLCASLSAGLKIIRQLRYVLLHKSIECRFALGVATLETPINAEKAWNMMGPGLAETRKTLGDKRNPNAYRFFLPDEHLIERLMNAIGCSMTNIEQDWTARQLEIVTASLSHHGSDTDLAEGFKITPRTLYKIRNAGQQHLYESQWQAVEQAAAELDQRYTFDNLEAADAP